MTTQDSAGTGSMVDRVELLRWSTAVLDAVGAPAPTAEAVADSLVESDLRGYSSHGVLRLPGYVAAIRDGVIDPRAQPEVTEGGRGGTFVVDGRNAFGQLTAEFAAEELARRVAEAGVSFAVTRRCRHVGRLGQYVEQLASRGFIAFAVVNSEPLVAASAGGARVIGTNPHAWGMPGGEDAPAVVVDFATSAVSAGRVLAARASGQLLPDGQIVDSDGVPSRDPGDLFDGGALLPFGGHKGFALGLVADMLAGMLSGTGSGSSPGYTGAHGLAMLAIDVSAFVGQDGFRSEIEALRQRVAASSAGSGGTAPMLPGEGSAARRAAAVRDGVRIPQDTATELGVLARSLGLAELHRR